MDKKDEQLAEKTNPLQAQKAEVTCYTRLSRKFFPSTTDERFHELLLTSKAFLITTAVSSSWLSRSRILARPT